ncbi:MAG: hypothetical protein ACLFPD_04950 [Desulfosudaceae bacterium]
MKSSAKKKQQPPERFHSYKQCPECNEKLPLHLKRCTQCGLRVGRIQPDGKAKRPIDWKGYLLSLLLIVALILYLWWAFVLR